VTAGSREEPRTEAGAELGPSLALDYHPVREELVTGAPRTGMYSSRPAHGSLVIVDGLEQAVDACVPDHWIQGPESPLLRHVTRIRSHAIELLEMPDSCSLSKKTAHDVCRCPPDCPALPSGTAHTRPAERSTRRGSACSARDWTSAPSRYYRPCCSHDCTAGHCESVSTWPDLLCVVALGASWFLSM